MKTRIQKSLRQIERDENVCILLAVESGSRAWGFASTDSDYDVRFIYAHPPAWYLSIQSKRDVIERPIVGELDFAGWDLPKALGLLRKSNPPLLEWLQSPIVYSENPVFMQRLRDLLPVYFSPLASKHHYLSMATKNYKAYLTGDTVRVKKYFYALRPILACMWIERGLGVVPIEFSKLLAVLDDAEVVQSIDSLLAKKRDGCELDEGPAIPVLSNFLQTQLNHFNATREPVAQTNDTVPLDQLFTDTLVDLYGNHLLTPR